MSTKEEDDAPQVYRASEISEENKKSRFQEYFGDKGVLTKEESRSDADERAGPKSYDGLIDGDTFDGGDGQVGCVGEEDNKLQQFESNEVIKRRNSRRIQGESVGGANSKAKQMNAFGTVTGYADELAEKGMKKIVDGEDKLQVRRQQFENYKNQQELQKQQRAKIQQLDVLTGLSVDEAKSGWKRGASRSYMDNLIGGVKVEDSSAWNKYAPPPAGGKSDGSAWDAVNLTGNEKVTDTVMCISQRGRPGYQTINVKNTVMAYEPFHCEFSGEAEGFGVEPKTGTLNRRSGAPIPITVSFKGSGPGDSRDALLVVATEEDKWLYQIQGRSE